MGCITHRCNWDVLVKFVFFGLVCFRLLSVCHMIRLMQFYFLCPEINSTSRKLLVAKSTHEPNNAIGHHNIQYSPTHLDLYVFWFIAIILRLFCLVQLLCLSSAPSMASMPHFVYSFMIVFIWIFEGELVRLRHGKKQWKGRG